MGRIKYFVYSISKIFPYNHRKPFIVISSILGMLIFMDFMINVSGSIYLITFKKEINEFISLLLANQTFPIFLVFIVLAIGYVSAKYYKNIKTAISVGYLIILILSLLPILLR
ncbi:hypothetical protein D5266_07855 [bacterium c-19]|nr:hypothetical protein [bacterium c-19]